MKVSSIGNNNTNITLCFSNEITTFNPQTKTSITARANIQDNYIHMLKVEFESYSLYSNYEKSEEFIFNLFKNQRKLARYKDIYHEYLEDIIDDEQFETLSLDCSIKIKEVNTEDIVDRILYLEYLFKKYAPEEEQYLKDQDLSDLLSIKANKITEIKRLINNESKENVISR